MKLKLILFLIVYMGSVAHAQAQRYFGQTDVGMLLGRVESVEREYDGRLNFTFSTFHGVRVNPSHVVGFSVGIDTYPGMTLVPMALGWRGFREKGKKFTWFGAFDIGGGSAMLTKKEQTEWSESWFDGGIFISPSIGLRKDTKDGLYSFLWTVGYKRQNASFYEGYYDFSRTQPFFNANIPPGFNSVRTEDYTFNSFFFKWGLMF